MNYKTSIVMLVICVLLALMVGSVGAKDIVISNGISLTDTAENRTVELKQVVTDLKVAPSTLATKSVVKGASTDSVEEDGVIYSKSPVSEALASIESPDIRAAYKAEYIAKYSDLVGENTVVVDGKTVVINIRDMAYLPDGRLQINLSATVDGVEKRVRNPYKIVNPPIDVYTSLPLRDKINNTDISSGSVVESPDNAILEGVSYGVRSLENGKATFDDGDPTLQIYQQTMGATTCSQSTYNLTTVSWNTAITGVGDGCPPSAWSTVRFLYGSVAFTWEADRTLMTFNTTSLNSSTYITNISLNLKSDGTSYTGVIYPTSVVFTPFAPSSNTVYAMSDYQTNKTTLYTDNRSFDSLNGTEDDKLDFYFTPSGISLVNKTGLTWIMGRTSYDHYSIPLPAVNTKNQWGYYNARTAGTASDPYLFITYAVTPTPTFTTLSTNYVNTIQSFNSTTADSDDLDAPNLYSNWSIGGVWTNITGSGMQNATIVFSSPGIYNTTLYVTNAAGTGTSSMQDVYIVPSTVDITVDTPIALNSSILTFTPVTNCTPSYYNLSFGDGSWTNTSSSSAVTHTYTTTNIYSPSLYLFNSTMGLINSTTKDAYIGINSMKYYPTTDGYVSRTTTAAWATIRAGAGTAVDSSATTAYARQSSSASASTYTTFNRHIEIYDVNANPVPAAYTITNASLNFYGNAHSSTFASNPNFVVTNVTALASLDSITSSDFNKYGNTPLSNSNITYAGYTDAGYNRMYLNFDGITLINSTAAKIPFMLRTSWDADNASPTWSGSKTAYFRPYTTEQAGTTQDPYLLVNFTPSPVYFISNTTVGIIGANGFQFNDTSPVFGATFNWSFGDGEYSDIQNATHTYATQGLFTVKYTSPVGGGYIEKVDYINISAPSFYCDPPLAGGLPFSVTCHDTSAVLTGDTHWIWGDGTSTDDGTDVSHTYVVAGDYDVQLQTPSATGDVTTRASYIHAGVFTPTADFTSNVTEVAAGEYVQFTDLSTNTPTSWTWDFDGGTDADSTSQNPVRQFNTVGNFSVNLTAINGAGSDSEVKPLYIRVYPAGWVVGMTPITSVDFTVSPYQYVNDGGSLTFTGTVTGGTATSYKWDFVGGTGTNASTINPTYAFTPVGNRTVNFTAYNAISSATMRKTDYIQVFAVGNPYANYIATPTAGEPGTLISFTDLSLKGNTTGEVYNWSFGDGIYSTTPYSSIAGDVEHVYNYGGVYDVNLSITNFNGSSYNFKQQYIRISTAPDMQLYPKYTTFHLKEGWGLSTPGVAITMTPVSTSLGDWDWVGILLGIPLEETPLDTEVLSQTTDSYGAATFYVIPTAKYSVTFTKAGYTIPSMIIVPKEDDYYIWVDSIDSTYYLHGYNQLEQVNVTILQTPINDTATTVLVTYNDTLSHTTGGTIDVLRDNVTPGGSRVLIQSFPVVSSSFTNTTVISHPTGMTGVVNVNATHTDFGMVKRTYTFSYKGFTVQLLGLTADVTLMVALGLIFLTAMSGGILVGRPIAVVACFEMWIFYAWGWFAPMIERGMATDLSLVLAMTIATIVAIGANMEIRKKKEKY